jgi:ubiquinone/menaquinone biosynthesis C-methylase UbiE
LHPDYGLDAPPVIRTCLIVAAAGLLALLALLLHLWSPRSPLAYLLFPLMSIGAAALLTALAMIYYSKVHKLRQAHRLLDSLSLTGNERVLDVGCGRGLYLITAATHVRRSATVEHGCTPFAVGLDIWNPNDLSGNTPAATLLNARTEAVADHVKLVHADARAMPFPDNTFDLILSCAALHNIPTAASQAEALREISRALKPAGRLVILDIAHIPEYADVLKSAGLLNITVHRRWYAPLITLATFAALRPGRLTARKTTST